MIDSEPKLLPLSAMARRLFVPASWLRAEAEAGRLPYLKAGARLLFEPETIENILVKRAKSNALKVANA